MRQERKVYEFLHQNFRDFFAAVHVLNEIKIGLQNKSTPSILKLQPLSLYIRRFAGQIAGEHLQTETPDPRPTIFMQTLDNIRGVFEKEKTGCTTWNIINTWKDTRAHLGGINFSALDLLGIGLQDVYCYKRYGWRYVSSLFDGGLVNEKCFILQGHTSVINSVAFHPIGKYFISGSGDNTIKLWDLQTGECLTTFQGHTSSINSVAFHPDGKSFISGSLDNTIKSWDWQTGECLATMRNIPGLYIAGCSFRNLHPESKLSPEAKNIMRQYGGIFDEDDQKRWDEAIQRVFNIDDLSSEQ